MAESRGAAGAAERPMARWKALLMCLVFVSTWVLSIPLLFVVFGGALSPHLGWPRGVAVAVLWFAVGVCFDPRIAAVSVLFVSFGSAALAGGGIVPYLFAAATTGMVTLNAVERTCSPKPGLVNFQKRCYRQIARHSELRGALDTVQPGRSFFACHPHGIFSLGWVANVQYSSAFHKVAGRCFYIVDDTLRNKGLFARILLDGFEGPHGGFRDNRRDTMERLMERGESVSMVPGALQEATLCETGRDRVVVRQRKGFVKFCLRHGYRLHPVYTFGESDAYWTFNGLHSFRLRLNKMGIPTVMFWGRPWCPLAPRQDLDLWTYVGRPLELPKIDAPSIEEVDEWHGKYIQALQEVFDTHKAEAGRPHAVLEVL